MEIIPRFVIEDDDLDLLWRFTAYMELLVSHAKIDYLRRQRYKQMEILAEQSDIDMAAKHDDPFPINKNEFEFEEDKLTEAFSKLTLLRRQILTLTFVEGLSALEVADKLNCSADYVYLQKHRALKALRDYLMDGSGRNGD